MRKRQVWSMSRRAEYTDKALTPEDVVSAIRERLGDAVEVVELKDRKGGLSDAVCFHDLWLRCPRDKFLELFDLLFDFDFPLFHVMSGNDEGEAVLLNYHFTLFQSSGRGSRLGVTVSVYLPKDDLVIPSIQDRIPGAEYSEREMREMLGISFAGMPNESLVFLPEDWDEQVKPWRRDDAGPRPEHIRELS